MPVTLNQTNFASGEISPSLYGRVDISRWQSALKACRNFIVRPYGGVENRAGTRFLNEVKTSADGAYVIPFAFNTEQTYILEFGDQYMRVFKDGGIVLDGVSPYEIAVPWSIAELADLKYTQSADVLYLVHPDHPPHTITRFDHDDWALAVYLPKNGPFQPVNVEETHTVYTSGVSGNINVYSTFPLFSAEMMGELFYIESMNEIPAQAWEVGKSITAGDIRTANGHYYEAENTGTSGTLRPDHMDGVASDGAVNWRYLHSGFGIVRLETYTSATECTASVVRTLPAEVSGTPTVKATVGGLTIQSAGTEGLRIFLRAQITLTAHGYSTGDRVVLDGAVVSGTTFGTFNAAMNAYLNGQHKITVVDANTFRFNDTIALSFVAGSETWSVTTAGEVYIPSGSFATYKWAESAWSQRAGWPRTVSFFQQRLVFASTRTQPQTFWMSRIDSYDDHGVERPVLDDDAITGTIAARSVNAIQHITDLADMIIHTTGGEWSALGQDNVVTPNTLALRAQSYYGSADVAPIVSGNVALFVQEKGRVVRDLRYSFDVDGYSGSNLSQLAEHLFRDKTIVQWAFAQEPYDAVFMVMSDGSLLTLTYVRDQEVIGWARHDTAGFFESVAVISESGRDAVYFVVRRTINGATKRYVERLEAREILDVKQCFFVDSGLTYDGTNTGATTVTLTGTWDNEDRLYTMTASAALFAATDVDDAVFVPYTDDEGAARVLICTITAYTSTTVVTVRTNRNPPASLDGLAVTDWQFARLTFSGLDHLEGETLSVLADGNVHPQVVVASGEITLQSPAAIVHAGLPYTSDFETLELSSVEESIRDRKMLINKASLLCESSRGLFAGTDPEHLREVKQSQRSNYDQPLPLRSGLFEVDTPARWAKGGTIFVRQSDPLPLAILSAMPHVTLGGS